MLSLSGKYTTGINTSKRIREAWPTLKTALFVDFVVQSPRDRLNFTDPDKEVFLHPAKQFSLGPREAIFIASGRRTAAHQLGNFPTPRGSDGRAPSPVLLVVVVPKPRSPHFI